MAWCPQDSPTRGGCATLAKSKGTPVHVPPGVRLVRPFENESRSGIPRYHQVHARLGDGQPRIGGPVQLFKRHTTENGVMIGELGSTVPRPSSERINVVLVAVN